MTSRIPNFFVVGAAKSGTTALHRYLSRHADIYMCPIKEPHYFSTDIRIRNFKGAFRKINEDFDLTAYLAAATLEERHIAFVEQWDQYLALFREASNEKAVGEASTGYLYSRTAAREINGRCPDARIVMILRNPVDRAFSHYRMDLAGGAAMRDFPAEFERDTSRAIQGWGITHLFHGLGMYSEQVKRYLDLFPRENIRVYLYEDWCANNQGLLSDLAQFLEVAPFGEQPRIDSNIQTLAPRHARLSGILGRTGIKRLVSRVLPHRLRERMRDASMAPLEIQLGDAERRTVYSSFAADIERLETLLDRDLSGWKLQP